MNTIYLPTASLPTLSYVTMLILFVKKKTQTERYLSKCCYLHDIRCVLHCHMYWSEAKIAIRVLLTEEGDIACGQGPGSTPFLFYKEVICPTTQNYEYKQKK